jgi:hypothetical protein
VGDFLPGSGWSPAAVFAGQGVEEIDLPDRVVFLAYDAMTQRVAKAAWVPASISPATVVVRPESLLDARASESALALLVPDNAATPGQAALLVHDWALDKDFPVEAEGVVLDRLALSGETVVYVVNGASGATFRMATKTGGWVPQSLGAAPPRETDGALDASMALSASPAHDLAVLVEHGHVFASTYSSPAMSDLVAGPTVSSIGAPFLTDGRLLLQTLRNLASDPLLTYVVRAVAGVPVLSTLAATGASVGAQGACAWLWDGAGPNQRLLRLRPGQGLPEPIGNGESASFPFGQRHALMWSDGGRKDKRPIGKLRWAACDGRIATPVTNVYMTMMRMTDEQHVFGVHGGSASPYAFQDGLYSAALPLP